MYSGKIAVPPGGGGIRKKKKFVESIDNTVISINRLRTTR
jgi:hypothetical protein